MDHKKKSLDMRGLDYDVTIQDDIIQQEDCNSSNSVRLHYKWILAKLQEYKERGAKRFEIGTAFQFVI